MRYFRTGRVFGVAAALLSAAALAGANPAAAAPPSGGGHAGGGAGIGGFHGAPSGGFHGAAVGGSRNHGAWNGGAWHGGWRGGGIGLGIGVVPGFYGWNDDPYDYYGSYGYTAPQTAYYCANPAGYYPTVTQCYSGWQPVPAG